MALVFAAIAPHGGLAIAEACAPEERDLAVVTQVGMRELGKLFAAAHPQAVVVATPHNVHIAGALGVVIAGRLAGSLAGAPPSVALDVPGEVTLSWLLLESLLACGLPAVGVSFGANDPASSVAPMDWGVLIPLWFMGGRDVPPLPLVVITPRAPVVLTTCFNTATARWVLPTPGGPSRNRPLPTEGNASAS